MNFDSKDRLGKFVVGSIVCLGICGISTAGAVPIMLKGLGYKLPQKIVGTALGLTSIYALASAYPWHKDKFWRNKHFIIGSGASVLILIFLGSNYIIHK